MKKNPMAWSKLNGFTILIPLPHTMQVSAHLRMVDTKHHDILSSAETIAHSFVLLTYFILDHSALMHCPLKFVYSFLTRALSEVWALHSVFKIEPERDCLGVIKKYIPNFLDILIRDRHAQK